MNKEKEKENPIIYYNTPVGRLALVAKHGRLTLCDWAERVGRTTTSASRKECRAESKCPKGEAGLPSMDSAPASIGACGASPDNEVMALAVKELDEYFEGGRKSFDIPLEPSGTPFQKAVWAELLRIPYGATVSYSAVAKAIGRPSAVRAVAAAIGANPISIMVPCHRVIGSDGSLTGYAGGLPAKARLLELEKGKRG